MNDINFNNVLQHGITLQSSGTTGTPKDLFQPPHKIRAASKVAIHAQQISSKSKIYTVCKLKHAGGLLAQTIPAYTVGADITVEPFSAYTFMRRIHNFTHTHLTPGHAMAVMQTKSFATADLRGLWVTCGSDRVSFDIIEAFVKRGATFMVNWGMTEVGPVAINTVFDTLDKVTEFKSRSIEGATLIGTDTYCDVAIDDNNVMEVSGDICIYDGWFITCDRVVKNDHGEYYYIGRGSQTDL